MPAADRGAEPARIVALTHTGAACGGLAFSTHTGYVAPVFVADTDESAFTLGPCATCERTVVAWLDLDASGALLTRCVHCDTPLHEVITVAGTAALADYGYALRAAPSCGGGCGGRVCRPTRR